MDKIKYPHLKVTPVRVVDHTNYNQLIGVKNHKNYLVNLISGKIAYKRGSGIIRTPYRTITQARKYIEEAKLLKKGYGKKLARRKVEGVVNPTVSDCWSDLMDRKRTEVTITTMRTYKNSWAIMEPFFRNRTLLDLTAETLMNFKTHYLTHHPKRNAEKVIAHLVMLAHDLEKKQLIPRLDFQDIKKIQEVIKRNIQYAPPGRVLHRSQVEALLSAAGRIKDSMSSDDKRTTADYREMLACRARVGILLAVSCGMRKGEILSLQHKDVRLEENLIKRWSQKNHKWRNIPLVDDDVIEALVEQKRHAQHSIWLFPMPTNPKQHLSSQVFDKVWSRVRQIAKVQCRFHDLRHTVATRMGQSGFPVPLACEILDMSISIFEKVYCKPSDEAKAEWMRTFYSRQSTKNEIKKQFD